MFVSLCTMDQEVQLCLYVCETTLCFHKDNCQPQPIWILEPQLNRLPACNVVECVRVECGLVSLKCGFKGCLYWFACQICLNLQHNLFVARMRAGYFCCPRTKSSIVYAVLVPFSHSALLCRASRLAELAQYCTFGLAICHYLWSHTEELD